MSGSAQTCLGIEFHAVGQCSDMQCHVNTAKNAFENRCQFIPSESTTHPVLSYCQLQLCKAVQCYISAACQNQFSVTQPRLQTGSACCRRNRLRLLRLAENFVLQSLVSVSQCYNVQTTMSHVHVTETLKNIATNCSLFLKVESI